MFSSPDQRVCHNCGTPQREGLSACASCGASLQTTARSACRECGEENTSDSEFCTHCGISTRVLPTVSFIQAISLGFKNYIKFNGRARRSEYWWFVSLQVPVLVVPLIWVVILIPTISVTTRRLHDIGRSGWWQFVPNVLLISALIFWNIKLKISMFNTELLLLAIMSGSLAILMLITLIIWWVRYEWGTKSRIRATEGFLR